MIGDYENALSERRWEPATGTGTANEVVPSDAWVTEISMVAPTGADEVATLIITRPGLGAYDTITVRNGRAFTCKPYDRGQLRGATLAFSNVSDYCVQYARLA